MKAAEFRCIACILLWHHNWTQLWHHNNTPVQWVRKGEGRHWTAKNLKWKQLKPINCFCIFVQTTTVFWTRSDLCPPFYMGLLNNSYWFHMLYNTVPFSILCIYCLPLYICFKIHWSVMNLCTLPSCKYAQVWLSSSLYIVWMQYS